MAKCVDCAWFPWKPGAELSMLPTMNCYPGSPRRKWTEDGIRTEHDCAHFKSLLGSEPAAPGLEAILEPVPQMPETVSAPEAQPKAKKGRRR